MITEQDPKMDATFTIYWSKYITPQSETRKESRKRAFYERLKRTSHTYNPLPDTADHDLVSYFHKV